MKFTVFYDRFTGLIKIAWKSAMMMAASKAIPKPSMIKEEPINHAVSISVNALITNKNNPKVIMVIGSVSMVNSGLTVQLRMLKISAAIIAAPKPLSVKPENNSDRSHKTSAFKRRPISHLIDVYLLLCWHNNCSNNIRNSNWPKRTNNC